MDRTLTHRPSLPKTYRLSKVLDLYAIFCLWRQRARTRKQLAVLDERMLADAGISIADREAELDKPFWR